tara:strand:+ start:517 stop:714 length:198 start_codon:yes stop_codon:yes gene_type:complete
MTKIKFYNAAAREMFELKELTDISEKVWFKAQTLCLEMCRDEYDEYSNMSISDFVDMTFDLARIK